MSGVRSANRDWYRRAGLVIGSALELHGRNASVSTIRSFGGA